MAPDSERRALEKIGSASILGKEAEEELRALIQRLKDAELRSLEQPLRDLIGRFLPKRQRALRGRLDARLGVAPPTEPKQSPQLPTRNLAELRVEWRERLQQLSEFHIFQWATYYRKELGEIFQSAQEMHVQSPTTTACRVVREELTRHASEIFQKGYDYQARTSDGGEDDTLAKALSGLQRFLAIPVDFYSRAAFSIQTASEGRALRAVCSAMLAGILLGYQEVRFGARLGSQLLPQFPRSWANFLAFFRGDDLATLEAVIEPGDFLHGLRTTVTPVLRAIDDLLLSQSGKDFCLPRIGQFAWESRRVEISLSFPRTVENKRYLEIQCFLNPSLVKRHDLEESLSRGTSLVVVSLRPDIAQWAQAHDILRTTLVDVGANDADLDLVAARSLETLRFDVSKHLRVDQGNDAITTNLARLFPLDNPNIISYFHVYRSSIRNLLKAFEADTGVRLWCSVRRSGKSTACTDLGATSGNAVLVNQTMDNTDVYRRSDVFYRKTTAAIQSGAQLDPTFFQKVIEECTPDLKRQEAGRFIFILDEYETLFDHLRLAAAHDQRLRYTVVQPLLNQMVAFSRQNLLIFIGQRPDSHYIIMDQNQLSPYVRQDRFPLFERSTDGTVSEFDELLRKVLTERVTFDADFSGAVYTETRGHPYLTVNVLVDFFQWMIDERRRFSNLNLTGADFEAFSAKRLSPDAMRRSLFYELFRQYVDRALGEVTKRQQRWVYAVFMVLKRMALHNPKTLTCSEGEFQELSKDVLAEFGWDADYLLKTTTLANFLVANHGHVGPAIPILGRIAMIAKARDD